MADLLFLILVVLSGINVPIAGLQRRGDRLDTDLCGTLVDAETQNGHIDAVTERVGGLENELAHRFRSLRMVGRMVEG